MLYRDFSTSPRHPGRPPYRTHAVVVMTLGWQLFTAQLEGGDLRSLEFPHFQKFFLCYECLYLSHGKFIEVVCDKKEEPPSLTTVYIYIYILSVCFIAVTCWIPNDQAKHWLNEQKVTTHNPIKHKLRFPNHLLCQVPSFFKSKGIETDLTWDHWQANNVDDACLNTFEDQMPGWIWHNMLVNMLLA